MKKSAIVLAACMLGLGFAPAAFCDVEFHALLMPSHKVEIVDTIPSPLPTGAVLINNGAVIRAGETLTIPDHGTVTFPATLRSGMLIDIH